MIYAIVRCKHQVQLLRKFGAPQRWSARARVVFIFGVCSVHAHDFPWCRGQPDRQPGSHDVEHLSSHSWLSSSGSNHIAHTHKPSSCIIITITVLFCGHNWRYDRRFWTDTVNGNVEPKCTATLSGKTKRPHDGDDKVEKKKKTKKKQLEWWITYMQQTVSCGTKQWKWFITSAAVRKVISALHWDLLGPRDQPTKKICGRMDNNDKVMYGCPTN